MGNCAASVGHSVDNQGTSVTIDEITYTAPYIDCPADSSTNSATARGSYLVTVAVVAVAAMAYLA